MENAKLDLILKKLDKLEVIEKDLKEVKNLVNNYLVKDVLKLDKRIESLERKAQ